MKIALTHLLLSLFIIIPSASSAHVVDKVDDIGVIIHTDPGDEPFAGEVTMLSVEIQDKNKLFDSSNCLCSVVVKKGEQTILSKILFENNNDPKIQTEHTQITFPEQGDYIVTVSGKPGGDAEFEPFSVDFKVPVNRDIYGKTLQKEDFDIDSNTLTIGAVIILILTLSLVVVKTRKKA